MNQTLKAPAESKLPHRLADGWNSLTYPAENGLALLYQLYIPKDLDPARHYPLILYMHSAGVRCDDNSHIYTGEAKFLRNLECGAYRDDVIVLAPCCPKTDKWVDVERWNCLEFDAAALPQSRRMAAAIELFADALASLPVDRTRLSLYGMSMGGFAVWDILARYPHTFAAAIVAAGCGSPSSAAGIADVPVQIFHGTADGAVPFESAVRMRDALIAAGDPEVKFTAFGGAGHGIWVRTADTDGLYDWLFRQKRKEKDA